MSLSKPKRKKDPELLNHIRSLKCLICKKPSEVHHVWHQASGGPDADFNCINLCRQHHQEAHVLATKRMALKYNQFNEWLLVKGWYFDETRMKWMHKEQERT